MLFRVGVTLCDDRSLLIRLHRKPSPAPLTLFGKLTLLYGHPVRLEAT